MIDPGSLFFTLLVFATMFALVTAIGLRLLASWTTGFEEGSSKSEASLSTHRTSMSSEDAAFTQRMFKRAAAPARQGAAAEPGTAPASGARATVRTILRVLSGIFLAYLVMITIISYFQASPHDGSYLITGILVSATLLAASYFHRLDQRFRTTESDVRLREDMLHTVQADVAAKIGSALLDGTKVEWSIASPEVYRLDLESLERGRTMLAGGKSFEDICRAIEPEYGSWVAGHQQAYQAVVRAALEHKG